MAKQDDYTRYTIRLPTPLYERVKAAAGEASVNSLIVQVLEEKYPAPLPSYRDLLTMTLDFLLREGFTSRTTADKDELLSKLDDLPEEMREDVANLLGQSLLEGLEQMVAEYRASHPPPTDD